MKPLFCVGEQVVLQSVACPHLSGDCIVREVRGPKKFADLITGEMRFGFGYDLNISHPSGVLWAEAALKKKHKPGDSFDSIMDSFKQPINTEL